MKFTGKKSGQKTFTRTGTRSIQSTRVPSRPSVRPHLRLAVDSRWPLLATTPTPRPELVTRTFSAEAKSPNRCQGGTALRGAQLKVQVKRQKRSLQDYRNGLVALQQTVAHHQLECLEYWNVSVECKVCKATSVTHTKRIYRNLLRKETSFVCYWRCVRTEDV